MKLLLAVDGSESSDAAVCAVASHLQPNLTEVLVLQVVEPRTFSAPPQMDTGYTPEQDEILKKEFAEAEAVVARAAHILKARGFQAATRVVEAETRSAILDLAAEWHADLIVLGSHGRRGLRRFLLGSVAQAVAHNAHCSVWIVRTSS
jgi:nucleotide-binding universal stress UspA family protein